MALRVLVVLCVLFCAFLSPSREFTVDLKLPWKYDCTKKTDGTRITNLNVSTTTPRKGDTVTMNVTYYLKENVSDVTAAVFVKYGAIPYFDGTYNLCKMNILNCPLKAGNGSTVFKYTLIQYQYIGTYQFHANIMNENQKELACFDILFQVSE